MDIKKEIISWFNGPQDYQDGILLLQEVTKKNKVLGKLIKRGDTKSSVEKLKWELNKIAGLKTIPAPGPAAPAIKVKAGKKATAAAATSPAPAAPVSETGTDISGPDDRLSLIGDKSIDSYPSPVKRLVNEYSSLYRQRGVMHKELSLLGEGNDSGVVESRKVLIDKIDVASKRMELLNEAFDEFETDGILPDESSLWKEDKGNKDPLPIEELKALKKNIQSSVVKDRNLLTYQTKTKGKKENPMPAGPKRTTLEKRIARKEKEILRIDQEIADRS